MFEAIIASSDTPYRTHQNLEKMLRDPLGEARYQFFILDEDFVWLRSPEPVGDIQWNASPIPEEGQVVTFMARLIPQVVRGANRAMGIRRQRKYLTGDERAHWIKSKLAEKGFALIGEPRLQEYTAHIEKKGAPPFFKNGVTVYGTAQITNAQEAFNVLSNGIGESKPFGFGSIIIMEIKQ